MMTATCVSPPAAAAATRMVPTAFALNGRGVVVGSIYNQKNKTKTAVNFHPRPRPRHVTTITRALPGVESPWSPTGEDMETVVDELAARAAAAAFYGDGDGDARVFIGVVGSPGSGKSTLAAEVCARLNAAAGEDVAVARSGSTPHSRVLVAQLIKKRATPSARASHRVYTHQLFMRSRHRFRARGRNTEQTQRLVE